MVSEFSKSVKYPFKNQKGDDDVKRVFTEPFFIFGFSRKKIVLNIERIWLLRFLLILLLAGCSPPDLKDKDTYEIAVREAQPIGKLTRKRMYGILMLYVDKDENPYTGWVRSDREEGKLKELGYLDDGQKQGTWMTWHSNAQKASGIHWKNDLMHGIFEAWHPNGTIKVRGQTKDGEVDGEWKRYYSSGQLAEIALNQIGHLVRIKVWRPDGNPCKESQVDNGNGAYNMYEENGTLMERRVFRAGIQIEETDEP
jgi:hypothetical protein